MKRARDLQLEAKDKEILRLNQSIEQPKVEVETSVSQEPLLRSSMWGSETLDNHGYLLC